MNFIFLLFIEVWTQWVLCKINVTGVTYFARDPLRSYFDEQQKNEIYFLNKHYSKINVEKFGNWMDELGFYVPSTVFQSFRDDGRVNMKGSVQWSAV